MRFPAGAWQGYNRRVPPLRPNFILPILLFCAAAWCARPDAPHAPVSVASLAAAHGGASSLEGVSGMLHNPATLRWDGGGQAEVGFIGLAEGLSPYGLFGYQEPEGPAGAVGGFRYTVDGYPYQGVVGGFSWLIGDDLSVGFAMTGAFAKGGFGADGHMGAWLRLGEAAEMGFWLRNAMASGIGDAPDGLSTERALGFGFGASYAEIALWKVHLHEVGMHYDFSTREIVPQGWQHGLSGHVWLPPGGLWGLTLGMSLDGYDPMPKMAYGLGLKWPLRGGAVRINYALSPQVSHMEGLATVTHSLALRYEVGKQMDILPPKARIEAMPSRMSVDSITHKGLYFRLTVEDPDGQPAAWDLQILRTDSSGNLGETILRHSGKELPPRLILWKGEDANGQPVPAGFYAYRFEATDKAGHVGRAPIGLIELKAAE